MAVHNLLGDVANVLAQLYELRAGSVERAPSGSLKQHKKTHLPSRDQAHIKQHYPV